MKSAIIAQMAPQAQCLRKMIDGKVYCRVVSLLNALVALSKPSDYTVNTIKPRQDMGGNSKMGISTAKWLMAGHARPIPPLGTMPP